MELYKTKVKKCGDIIRIHKYEKVVTRGYKSKRVVGKSSNSNVSEEEREKRRIKKLYKSRSDIKYCYVKYKQDRGIYHYHVILNISFIDKDVLDKIWPYGRSQVSRIKNVNAIATYMAHHINKETVAKKDYKSKVFQKSRTCEIPKWTYGKDAENILNKFSKTLENIPDLEETWYITDNLNLTREDKSHEKHPEKILRNAHIDKEGKLVVKRADWVN